MIVSELLGPVILVLTTLAVGAYLVAVIDGLIASALGMPLRGSAWLAPLARGAWLLTQQANVSEAPDWRAWRLAPALYLVLAAVGLAVVPFSKTLIPHGPRYQRGAVGQRRGAGHGGDFSAWLVR